MGWKRLMPAINLSLTLFGMAAMSSPLGCAPELQPVCFVDAVGDPDVYAFAYALDDLDDGWQRPPPGIQAEPGTMPGLEVLPVGINFV